MASTGDTGEIIKARFKQLKFVATPVVASLGLAYHSLNAVGERVM